MIPVLSYYQQDNGLLRKCDGRPQFAVGCANHTTGILLVQGHQQGGWVIPLCPDCLMASVNELVSSLEKVR